MKFRCPYCKHTYDGKPKVICSNCGKTMTIPGHLRKITFRDRRKMKEQIARVSEKKRHETATSEVGFRRRPMTLLIIMGVLVAVGAMLYGRVSTVTQSPRNKKDPNATAKKELFVMSVALELFRSDIGHYPTTEEGLLALVKNPGTHRWAYNYLTLVKMDPWGSSYHYGETNGVVTLYSHGPDQQPGTADDIIPEPLDEGDVRSWIYQSEQYAKRIQRHRIIKE